MAINQQNTHQINSIYMEVSVKLNEIKEEIEKLSEMLRNDPDVKKDEKMRDYVAEERLKLIVKRNQLRVESIEFDKKEKEILAQLAYKVWSYIAPDLEGAIKFPASRNTVFEVVVDADRLKTFSHTDEERAVAGKFYDAGWKKQEALKKVMFPDKEYL